MKKKLKMSKKWITELANAVLFEMEGSFLLDKKLLINNKEYEVEIIIKAKHEKEK
jgi:hypothetical protein